MNKASGSDFNFVNGVVDARKFISFFHKHVLALQTIVYFTNGQVPFRYLANLGGSDMMRGYYSGRYRENNFMALQAEYRFPLFWRFGMVAFAGIGDVSSKPFQYRFNPIKYSLGTGLRIALKPREKLNLRIDFGFGNHSYASYITVTEAF